jgi:hypothetical protein
MLSDSGNFIQGTLLSCGCTWYTFLWLEKFCIEKRGLLCLLRQHALLCVMCMEVKVHGDGASSRLLSAARKQAIDCLQLQGRVSSGNSNLC